MHRSLLALDHRFDAALGAAANPLKQLGALAFWLLALLAASGIVLYALLDTSVQGAYSSVERLHAAPWRSGDLLRGVHRYAADAFALVLLLHLLREAALAHFAAFRRYAWITGVALLPIAWACGVGGFWIGWDRLGQYSATAAAEWFDALPLLASPLARNFLGTAVSDRLFSLFVFVHLGLPLLLVFLGWAHIQRLGHPAVFPARRLAVGTTGALLALALLLPVRGQGPADLASVPARLQLDWFWLWIQPLADRSAPLAWALLFLGLGLLLMLPLLPRAARAPVARVAPEHCGGCGRCVDDCPYGAISLVPHPLRRAGVQLAQVNAAQCASCGICAGACPSSTPFRKAGRLATGIDLPQRPVDALRDELRRGLAAGRDHVVIGCDEGARVATFGGRNVLALSLPCAGLLPPAFVEFAYRQGARSVLVTACREGACAYRLGARFTAQRLQGAREPHLRPLPEGLWQYVPADAGEEGRVIAALQQEEAP